MAHSVRFRHVGDANNALVIGSGAAYGMARTLPLRAGIGIGVAAIMLTVAPVGSSVVTNPRVGAALEWIGVVYLLRLAWEIARAEPEPRGPDAAGSTRGATPLSFAQGALFQVVNPKLWLMVSGAVVAYGQEAGGFGRTTLPILFAFVFGTMAFVSTVA